MKPWKAACPPPPGRSPAFSGTASGWTKGASTGRSRWALARSAGSRPRWTSGSRRAGGCPKRESVVGTGRRAGRKRRDQLVELSQGLAGMDAGRQRMPLPRVGSGLFFGTIAASLGLQHPDDSPQRRTRTESVHRVVRFSHVRKRSQCWRNHTEYSGGLFRTHRDHSSWLGYWDPLRIPRKVTPWRDRFWNANGTSQSRPKERPSGRSRPSRGPRRFTRRP